ncbi:unnamed protein product [Cuscuta epithymum]|uniref:Uncharacterized protein n=1 Tax=Cuscuta epithymum TaxID=186058 RepID=A0AAV0EUD0_9ASTE|nr:unnamed protein product [Cuscuta epithymum]
MQTWSKSGIFKPKTIFNLNTVVRTPDPTCFSMANKHLKWRVAMAEEFNALISNHTWDLVPFDAKKNVVGCKWIYKTKYLADRSVERYKARYLQGTSTHGLLLQSSHGSTEIIAYSNADWAGCPDSGRSTSGYAIFLGPNLISWRSKKQPTVSLSSTEAEYRTIAYIVQDTLHIRSVLFELGFPIRVPTTLYCDNVSASYLSVNPIQHARSKHINIDYHFVRERVAHGDLRVKFVPTQAQLADIFTKCLSPQRFTLLRDNLRIVSPAQLEGV